MFVVPDAVHRRHHRVYLSLVIAEDGHLMRFVKCLSYLLGRMSGFAHQAVAFALLHRTGQDCLHLLGQLAGTDGSIISGAEAFTEAFGENFSIDLNSYAEGGTHSAVDTTADFDADGVMDQQLLGTFNVNVNGSDVQGYNTLDDVDWLSSNYGVAISEEATQATTDVNGLLDTSNLGEFQAMGEFYNTALEKNQMMRQQLEGVEEAIGFDTESVDAYKELLVSQAEVKAKDFLDSVEITPRERETAKSVGTGSNGTANIDGSYTLNGVQYNTIMDGSELENLVSQIQSGGNGNQWGYPDACLSFNKEHGDSEQNDEGNHRPTTIDNPLVKHGLLGYSSTAVSGFLCQSH